ncbi:siderophore-iron reductase, Fe-S cluster protein [Hahella sp. CCB-MM4]|uniref:IucA/IucC family C-terminal-domain containing protein n=1 Tax=Hahella sp. (strain CCB-MM4) TaxID=1926491 RepID=UPI000B9C4DD3|nr:IucA/IucC family C-terminal-domain containing protein [Hahella sp. CCB-MM4]OZG73155.1 siderophore-iron reductase, Fe-S cluster protein [Hahella sp. CCB-MM4]
MKKLSLDPAQWATLNSLFRLVSAEDRDQIHSIRTIDLLDPQICTELLDYLTPVIHSPSRRVTASLLSKRIAFLSTASSLYAMSAYNQGLNMSLQNCYLEFGYENRLWQSHMPLTDLSLSAPENGQRESWRRMLIRQLFADNLSRLWQVLVEVAKVPLSILWENTAVRVYSLYERRMSDLGCVSLQNRVDKDFHYLINEAPAELFGTSENPLHKYFWPRQQVTHSNKSVRFRKTCCYYYRASEPKEYCSTCPLIRPKRPRKPKNKEIITV